MLPTPPPTDTAAAAAAPPAGAPAPRRRVLFVDDEPSVLAGLRRMLRPLRDRWDMYFAPGGPEALDLLAREPIEVVVSDMRMPGMDGAALLNEVRRLHPHIVRIILSGHSDREMILRSVGPTHQYLAKPCDADTLRDTITRACALRELLHNDAIKSLVSQITALPSLPSVYAGIVAELQSPDASIRRIGNLIATDIGITAKILQLVNSAFFGLRRHVATPVMAVNLLGIDTVKALVLSVQLFSSLRSDVVGEFGLNNLWEHSLAVGTLAREIAAGATSAGGDKVADHALMAGLLHDAGLLVLATNLPGRYRQVAALARAECLPLWQAEQQALGASHDEVGAYLLGLWGLPDAIVEAVALHHQPGRCVGDGFGALTAVHVADVLDRETRPHAIAPRTKQLDHDYLRRVGVLDREDAWRELATRFVGKVDGP